MLKTTSAICFGNGLASYLLFTDAFNNILYQYADKILQAVQIALYYVQIIMTGLSHNKCGFLSTAFSPVLKPNVI